MSRHKKEISKGRIMRVLDYKILRFANVVNISLKDQKGDTVCDAFGSTNKDALADAINKSWDIGYDEIPKVNHHRRIRRVRRRRIDKLRDTGWAIKEMWYVLEEEFDGRYSLSVKNDEHDVAELTIYAKTINELHSDIYTLGYEFYLGHEMLYKEQIFIWKTFVF